VHYTKTSKFVTNLDIIFFKNLSFRKFSQPKMCLEAKPLSICPGLISDIMLEFWEAEFRKPHFALFQKYIFWTFLYFPQNRSGWRNVVIFTYLRNFPYQFRKEYQLSKFPATKGISILLHCTVEHRRYSSQQKINDWGVSTTRLFHSSDITTINFFFRGHIKHVILFRHSSTLCQHFWQYAGCCGYNWRSSCL